MAENVQQPVEIPVPLQLFGGLVTEMAPSDLPEGISPDCQDVVFTPGAVSSRPAAQRTLPAGLLPAGTTVTYQKTFVTPSGDVKNLYLTSDGQFWVVQLVGGVQTATLLTTVAAGSYASSVTSFGKELITFHNNTYGTDTARIFDGVYLDRATQCGPGAPPSIQNLALPPVTLVAAGGAPATISTITPTDPVVISGTTYWTTITIVTTAPHGFVDSQIIETNGTTQAEYNPFINRISVIDSVTFKMGFNQTTFTTATGGTASIFGSTLIRAGNLVTAVTGTAHGLKVGNQAQITKVTPTSVGGGITSIVIDNEVEPGIATVTTTNPHGLLPENVVTISGVANAAVGGGIAFVKRAAQVSQITTTLPHGLSLGSVVQIATSVAGNASFDGQYSVLSILDSSNFTYAQVEADQASTADAGTVSYLWPLSTTTGNPNQNIFEVLTCPSSTTFKVALNYTDGTWTSGTVSFDWNGTFYVTNVVSTTEFQYRQYGPDATTVSVGEVTPFGQIAPGKHQMVVMFQTRQGLITAPSPSLTFIANGGQYLVVNDIPKGPANTIARILAFTGADGSNFFYIPSPGFVSGLVVSTSTVVNDNTTTSVVLDFSDNTLFTSIAIDVQGNNLFALGTMGPALGVSSYASRSNWFGMRNSLQNFLNLGFEGGYLDLGKPLGWTLANPGGVTVLGTLTPTDTGMGWLMQSGNNAYDGVIQQSAFEDSYSVPILKGNTDYSVQAKIYINPGVLAPQVGFVNFDIYDTQTLSILSKGQVAVSGISQKPEFYQVTFNNTMPVNIPSTAVFRIYISGVAGGMNIVVDDVEIYPTLNPFVNTYWWSYVNLPDSLDLLTGQMGTTSDSTAIQCSFVYRDAYLFLTKFGLYETRDISTLEPSNWEVRQVSTNNGACGPKAICTGENFSAWVTAPSSQPPVGRGLYLYTGGAVYKLSQEIQPDFDRVNSASEQSIWLVNDAVTRRIYIGLPLDTSTSPNVMYVMDYREMDTASEIASKSPIHISFSGKMICSDLSRKWTRWSLAAQCAEVMNVFNEGVYFCIGAGNGEAPGVGTGFGNCYWFNPNKFTDDDYGQIVPYYVTYFFVNHEMEMAIQVGAHRKLFVRFALFIHGTGNLVFTPYADSLSNPWPASPLQQLSQNPTFDTGGGLNVSAERAAFKISVTPVTGTDVDFELNKLIITMKQQPVSPIRLGAI